MVEGLGGVRGSTTFDFGDRNPIYQCTSFSFGYFSHTCVKKIFYIFYSIHFLSVVFSIISTFLIPSSDGQY